jgi:hypothetical protein
MDAGVPHVRAHAPVTAGVRAAATLVVALALLACRSARGQEARAEAAVAADAVPAGLAHEAIASATRGAPITVAAGVQGDLEPAELVLAYRAEGEATFRSRTMKLGPGGLYRAEIPGDAATGRTVAYYIEARDADGAPIAGRGSQQSPLLIQLAGELPKDDDDDVLAGRRYFVALLAGTGVGWATGDGDTNADMLYRPAALAPAWLGQLAPEVGVWLSPTLMISVKGRFQAVTGTTDVYADGRVYHTANYAAAAFLKATWIASGQGRAHPFFSLAAGVGRIRHVVKFDELTTCGASGREVCVDTIAAGPVALGPGVGFFVDLGSHLMGVFALDSQLTLPDYSVNIDGDLGLAVRF